MAATDSQNQLHQNFRANRAVNLKEFKWLQTHQPKYNILELLPSRKLPHLLIKTNSQTQQMVFRTCLPTGESVIIKMINAADQKLCTFDSIIHEAFIGLRGLNQLQSACFASILDLNLGQGSSSNPHIPSCNYVIYEDAGDISLYNYLSTASPSDLQRVIIQLISALYWAYTQIGFTHYDLHLGNIMIHNGIPVIIDYGLAHAQFEETKMDLPSKDLKKELHHYGVILSSGAIYNRAMWYHDVFKLLMALLAECTEELLIEMTVAEFRAQYQKVQDQLASAKEDASLAILTRGHPTSAQNDRITQLTHQLQQLQTQYNKLLPRPYMLRPWIQDLLQYFNPEAPFDGDYLRSYQQIYPYFQPSVEMMLKGYNFDHFMEYMAHQNLRFRLGSQGDHHQNEIFMGMSFKLPLPQALSLQSPTRMET